LFLDVSGHVLNAILDNIGGTEFFEFFIKAEFRFFGVYFLLGGGEEDTYCV
jgi:hypothetical protein